MRKKIELEIWNFQENPILGLFWLNFVVKKTKIVREILSVRCRLQYKDTKLIEFFCYDECDKHSLLKKILCRLVFEGTISCHYVSTHTILICPTKTCGIWGDPPPIWIWRHCFSTYTIVNLIFFGVKVKYSIDYIKKMCVSNIISQINNKLIKQWSILSDLSYTFAHYTMFKRVMTIFLYFYYIFPFTSTIFDYYFVLIWTFFYSKIRKNKKDCNFY